MAISNIHIEPELLLRVADGDEQAFQQLILLYSERIFFHTLTFVKSWHEAEELVQDIFLKIWQKRDKLPQVENWDKYLFTLSRNFLINSMRGKAQKLKLGDIEEVEDNLRAYEQHENKELRLLLEKAIGQLPAQKRDVFTMIHLEGLSQEEVSRRLGIATRTVRWNLVAGITEIRDFLHRNSDHMLCFLFCISSASFF